MGRLEGKVAVITGAGAGIARAATAIFTREGARVVAAEIDAERGEASAAAARAAGGDATFVHCDVTDEESVAALMKRTVELYGKLDVLFSCAGGSVVQDKQLLDVDMGIWDSTLNLDLKGPFLGARHAIPLMRDAGGGPIVNVSSIVALRGSFSPHIYTTAKGGVIALTRSIAGAYAKDRIRCNAICPGITLTERVKSRVTAPSGGRNESATAAMSGIESMDTRYPFGTGQPEDIANVALFLASDESRMVNGAIIPAEGGMSAY